MRGMPIKLRKALARAWNEWKVGEVFKFYANDPRVSPETFKAWRNK